MKIGGEVTYVDAGGGSYAATVAALSGTGPSGNKTLDLVLSPALTVLGVVHEADRVERTGFWTLGTVPVRVIEPASIPGDAPRVAPVEPEPEPEHDEE